MFDKKAVIAGALLSVLVLTGCSTGEAGKTSSKATDKPSVTDTATADPITEPSDETAAPVAPEATNGAAAVGNETACEYLVIEFSTIWTPEETDSDDNLAVTVDNLDDTIIAVDDTIDLTEDASFITALNTLSGSAADFSSFISASDASAEEISADPEYSTLTEKFLADTSVIDTFCGTTETVTE